MTEMERRIQEIGIIPVVKLEDAATAVPMARALCEGGLPAAEVTFRTAGAAEAIARIRAACPDMLVGAGTVLTPEQVDAAYAAGAMFAVSPGFNPRTVARCQEIGLPILPGCATPSDMEAAMEMGLTTVKFFPAEAAGGLPMLKAMSAPYGVLRFMPTGGINPQNMLAYLNFPKVLACGGSFMVKEEWLRSGNYAAITAATREAVQTMLGFSLAHVGLPSADPVAGAAAFTALFGLPTREAGTARFSGEGLELLAAPCTTPHVAIRTHSVLRALAYLRRCGVAVNEESVRCDASGTPVFAYLRDPVGGFAVHLVQ